MTRILDALLLDLRFTGRMLAAKPGWTLAAILCLSIAMAANTAAFTLVNGLLLRPLPFEQPDRLVMIALREPTGSSTRPFSLREYRIVAEQSSGTGPLLARTFFPVSLGSTDGARMAQAELVSGNYFETLRVEPFLGHHFDSSADRYLTAPVAVLSYRLWRVRFHSDPNVIGQSVRVNGRPTIVVGIAPAGFVGATQLVAADLWLPASMYPDLASSDEAELVPMFGVMGRLHSGIAKEEAVARLSAAAATLPRTTASQLQPTVVVTAATGFGVPPVLEGAVLMLSSVIYALTALLMTVASSNVAALVLAGGASRSREIAIRLSVGATWPLIARQLLIESLVLALASCAAGVLVALWLTQALVTSLTTPFEFVTYAIDVRANASVFAYSALATALAAVLCGVAPIRYAARVNLLEVLKQSAAKGRSRESLRALNGIIVVQFAVSTALLASAGTLVRTYVNAELARPGFSMTGLLAASLDLDQLKLDQATGVRLYRTVTERLAALPGVVGVSLTRNAPFAPASDRTVTALAGIGNQALRMDGSVAAMLVSPDYFETLGVAIRQGRGFDQAQPPETRVAVINDVMAQRLWPGASAVGRIFTTADNDGAAIEVIGVVPDARERALTQGAQPAFYQPFPHQYSPRMTVLIRVHGDAGLAVEPVRQTLREINADLSIINLRTVDALFETSVVQRRVPATAVSVVGLLGLLLSAVGLFGVIAYSVRERTRELAIRLSLGARPADVRWLVLRQGLTIVGIGLMIGAFAIVILMRLMRRTLFGVGSLDLPTLVAVGIVLIATGVGALYWPALWASRVAPASTLRSE